MGQSGWLLCRLLGPLIKTGLPIMNSVLNPLAKCVSISLELTAAACSNRCSYSKETFWFRYDCTDNLKWRKKNDIMKMVKYLEEQVKVQLDKRTIRAGHSF